MTLRQKSSQLAACALATLGALLGQQAAVAQCNCAGSAGGAIINGYPLEGGMTIEMGGTIEYPPMPGGQLIDGNSLYLTVNVPEAAVLTINGDPTISVGPTRYFVVKGLDPDRLYEFKIVAETANAAGVAMEETKTVKVQPGNTEFVTLNPVKRKVVPVILVPVAPPPPVIPVVPVVPTARTGGAAADVVSSRRLPDFGL